jgi:hypothetical protein
MPETCLIEHGRQWPRRYTPVELEAIAKAASVEKCGPVALEKLQRAAEAYQWASLVDDKDNPLSLSATNKARRAQLKHILKLAPQGVVSSDEIKKALNDLDAIGSQLLGLVRADPKHLARAAKRAIAKIPRSGPDPKRARRQFIGDLVRILDYATGRPHGRSVLDREQGQLLEYVRAALSPFKAAMCCEADIKFALEQRKRVGAGKRKTAASAKR